MDSILISSNYTVMRCNIIKDLLTVITSEEIVDNVISRSGDYKAAV